jgi:hypothetical protein
LVKNRLSAGEKTLPEITKSVEFIEHCLLRKSNLLVKTDGSAGEKTLPEITKSVGFIEHRLLRRSNLLVKNRWQRW